MKRKLLAAAFVVCFANIAHAQVAPAGDPPKPVVEQPGFLKNLQVSVQNGASRAQELVESALALIGTRYRRGGTSVRTGFDCSGFVRAIYEESTGLLLPRTAAEQAQATRKIPRDDLRPGDLVFFNTLRRAYSHVGIYIGNGKFIHSPRPGQHVRIDSLGLNYWAKRFDGARRVTFH